MCVFMLDDARGSVEVVVFPETFKQWGHLAENGRMVLVTGSSSGTTRPRAILATEIAPIEVLTRATVHVGGDHGCPRRRTIGRRSSAFGTCCRTTRAIGAWRSTSKCGRRCGRCG